MSTAQLEIAGADWADLVAAHPGAALWVRQTGTFAQSDPLLLTTLS